MLFARLAASAALRSRAAQQQRRHGRELGQLGCVFSLEGAVGAAPQEEDSIDLAPKKKRPGQIVPDPDDAGSVFGCEEARVVSPSGQGPAGPHCLNHDRHAVDLERADRQPCARSSRAAGPIDRRLDLELGPLDRHQRCSVGLNRRHGSRHQAFHQRGELELPGHRLGHLKAGSERAGRPLLALKGGG